MHTYTLYIACAVTRSTIHAATLCSLEINQNGIGYSEGVEVLIRLICIEF